MKSVCVFMLLNALIAILALGEVCLAAETDGDDYTDEEETEEENNSPDDDDDDDDSNDDSDDEDGESRYVRESGYSARVSASRWENGRCQREATIKGPGFDDVIRLNCSLENFLLINNTILVVGGVVYSDSPNTVVVVRGGRCEKRTYIQSQRGGDSGSAANSPVITRMNPRECAAAKRTIAEVRRDAESQQSNRASNLQGYSAIVSVPQRDNGRCHKEVTLKGPGIVDVISLNCSLDNFMMSNNTILIVGGAVYSDSPNTVVVVRGGRCEKRTYIQPQRGGAPGRAANSPVIIRMNNRECATVKRTIVEVRRDTESKQSARASNLQGYSASISTPQRENGRCQREITVRGSGIDDAILVGCTLDTFMMSNITILVVADAIYSDSPNTMVVVRGGRCEKRTYIQPQRGVASGRAANSPVITRMNNRECTTVKRTMAEVRSENESLQSARASNLQGYSARVSASRWENSRCQREATIKGPGFDDVIRLNCSLENFMLINNTILVVGGVVYSDSRNIVVVVRGGRCEKRTYIQSQSGDGPGSATDSPVITWMNHRECSAVKKTMAEARRETVVPIPPPSTRASNILDGIFGSIPGNIVKATLEMIS